MGQAVVDQTGSCNSHGDVDPDDDDTSSLAFTFCALALQIGTIVSKPLFIMPDIIGLIID